MLPSYYRIFPFPKNRFYYSFSAKTFFFREKINIGEGVNGMRNCKQEEQLAQWRHNKYRVLMEGLLQISVTVP